MKAMEETVSVVAYFGPDGNVKPLAFRHNRKEYKITSIRWWKFGAPVWTDRATRIYCVGTQDEKIAELVWEVDTGVWWLTKLG
jgi:hypothetical protein